MTKDEFGFGLGSLVVGLGWDGLGWVGCSLGLVWVGFMFGAGMHYYRPER